MSDSMLTPPSPKSIENPFEHSSLDVQKEATNPIDSVSKRSLSQTETETPPQSWSDKKPQHLHATQDSTVAQVNEVGPPAIVPKTDEEPGITETKTKAAVIKKLKELASAEIGKSEDLGGHGGNRLATVEVDGVKHYLFLKPKDETEARNYQIIEALSPGVLNFMPQIYGELTINGQNFLVMENTRKNENGTNLRQLADLKLAGLVTGLDNPIADQDEILSTRDVKKPALDYMQMAIGAERAKHGFMLYKGSKLTRLYHFDESRKNLLDALQGATSEQRTQLNQELYALTNELKESPIAFIGASIILIDQEDGFVRPILIDPAHIQVREDQKDKIDTVFPIVAVDSKGKPQRERVYYGDQGKYEKQKLSNDIGMRGIMSTVTAVDVTQIAEAQFTKGIPSTPMSFNIKKAVPSTDLADRAKRVFISIFDKFTTA